MGRVRRSRTHSNPKKNQATSQKLRRYGRDMDQIHQDLKDNGVSKKSEDLAKKDIEDLPGMGEFTCVPCARYFANDEALKTHKATKLHKRRLKKLQEEPYSVEESVRAAGIGVDNGKRQSTAMTA